MDVGPGSAHDRASAGEDAEDLLVFVDRLAAAAQDEPTTARAKEQIGTIVRAGSTPPGLRRLAEALAASVAEIPPAQRHPADDPTSVVPAMRNTALVVLDEAGPAEVATAISALVADGRRVVVTAETDAELDEVRIGVATGRTVDALPDIPHAELRELRRLLATSTAAARARAGQDLPAADALPPVDEVRRLCEQAARSGHPEDAGTVVPALLSRVEPDRREAVTSIARCVSARLDALGTRRQFPWEWELLGHLIHTRHRATFDRTQEDVAQAATIVHARRNAPPVTFLGPLSADAVDLLCNYYEFLEAGGRTRAYFRPTVQRDVQPVLRRIRVADREPVTAPDVLRVLDHLELAERMGRIVTGCTEMGVPAPRGPGDLSALAERLVLVANAARSVGSLRHDVLFLAADSPLSVPDVDSAARVSSAILDYAENGSPDEAGHRLGLLADQLADRAAVTVTAPEHQVAVDALRRRDADAYENAVDALGAARRELRDEVRRTTLLRRLRATAPTLASAWDELHERDSGSYGLACFTRSDVLLGALPAPDSADVVVVVGAAQLGVERLLLTAVAPRLIAVVAPDEQPEGSPSLLSVLQRAAALVIRGRTTDAGPTGRVVQFNPAARAAEAVSAVGQAGA
ncbi:hypothetical protein [Pseudonocardia abyssalis]|uniref:Uncharacterized protein n=1 Tax=Pseudonocardia abyssalis TaxID=2792008 RepID=A0ABS6UZ82_9PSEU|nr:hypothetical protein [Pseudonocardia abyssalis]MBW0116058.1 hypothetical protein [Pseudonocardia abyssalis]MBW0137570.1 hypothetical protein [Pseudonocardia abyssalis]